MEEGFKGVEIVLLDAISGSRQSGGRCSRKQTGDFRCVFSNVDIEKKCHVSASMWLVAQGSWCGCCTQDFLNNKNQHTNFGYIGTSFLPPYSNPSNLHASSLASN